MDLGYVQNMTRNLQKSHSFFFSKKKTFLFKKNMVRFPKKWHWLSPSLVQKGDERALLVEANQALWGVHGRKKHVRFHAGILI